MVSKYFLNRFLRTCSYSDIYLLEFLHVDYPYTFSVFYFSY